MAFDLAKDLVTMAVPVTYSQALQAAGWLVDTRPSAGSI